MSAHLGHHLLQIDVFVNYRPENELQGMKNIWAASKNKY
jgi:hypothetical protein